MVERRDIGSWIEGPASVTRSQDDEWPGKRLGRPQRGSGAVARVGRRLVAIVVDWGLAMLVSSAFLDGNPWGTLAVFGAVQVVLVGTVGFSPGHGLLGMRVEQLHGGWVGPVRALVRSALLCLAVPALIWDRDQRGMHDRAAGTVLVRR